MNKIYTLFLLLAGGATALALPAQKMSLDISKQKTVNLETNINTVKKAPATPAAVDAAEWNLLGTGSYTDDILTNTGLDSETWEVQIYENATTPGYYLVENPYGNGKCPYFEAPFESCDFLLHAENPDAVWMEYVELKNIDFGLTDGTYCPGYTGDMAGYYIGEGFFDAETAIAMGMCGGKMLGGSITFEPQSLLLDFPLFGEDGLTLAANCSGLFRVALPGAADYSLSVECKENCTENDLMFSYKAGADVAEVHYDMFKGMLSFEGTDTELLATVKENGKVATDGAVTVTPESGINTVVVVAMSDEGAIVGSEVFYCYGQHEEADEWTTIGNAEYSEDVLASISPSEVSNTVYFVEIQESKTTPGRYRLVDLYGPSYTYYSDLVEDDNIMDHTHHHYAVVDATNPEMVYIEASPLGADFGFGPVSLFSEGWLSMQLGADITDPAVLDGFGTLKDGKITFLGGALFLYMPDFGMPRGNINHKFYIKLPVTDTVDNVSVAGTEAPVYYSMAGVRLSGVPTVAGVYVKVAAGNAEKVYVK